MKELIDVHVVLATPSDFEQWDEFAGEAAEKFNVIVHAIFDHIPEDIQISAFDQLIQDVWENWANDRQLMEIDDDDLVCWAQEFLLGWDLQQSQNEHE